MFSISLKNNSETWEDVTANNCLEYLKQYNGLTDEQICDTIENIFSKAQLQKFQTYSDVTNSIYWIVKYNHEIKAYLDEVKTEHDKKILNNLIGGRADLLDEVLVNDFYATLILKKIVKEDKNIMLQELNLTL